MNDEDLSRLDLRRPEKAVIYLNNTGYEQARVLGGSESDEPRIGYNEDTGDGTWEVALGPWNDWAPKERGRCCSKYIGKKGKDNKFNFCPECGAGLKGKSVWVRDEENSDLIDALEKSAYIDEIREDR
jgi:hypothetical protein